MLCHREPCPFKESKAHHLLASVVEPRSFQTGSSFVHAAVKPKLADQLQAQTVHVDPTLAQTTNQGPSGFSISRFTMDMGAKGIERFLSGFTQDFMGEAKYNCRFYGSHRGFSCMRYLGMDGIGRLKIRRTSCPHGFRFLISKVAQLPNSKDGKGSPEARLMISKEKQGKQMQQRRGGRDGSKADPSLYDFIEGPAFNTWLLECSNGAAELNLKLSFYISLFNFVNLSSFFF